QLVRQFRLQNIAEAAVDLGHRTGVGVKRDRLFHQSVNLAKIIYSMKMIGMRMGQQYGVDPAHARVDQLLAQIGRRVDQTHRAGALDQYRRAAPAVAWVSGIAAPPTRSDRRHAPGGAAAEDRVFHAAGRRALRNSRKKLSVVASASASGSMPFS